MMRSATSSEGPRLVRIAVAMCTNKGSHRDAFSNEGRQAPHVSRGLLSRPLSLE